MEDWGGDRGRFRLRRRKGRRRRSCFPLSPILLLLGKDMFLRNCGLASRAYKDSTSQGRETNRRVFSLVKPIGGRTMRWKRKFNLGFLFRSDVIEFASTEKGEELRSLVWPPLLTVRFFFYRYGMYGKRGFTS